MASVGSSHNRPTSAEDHEEALLLGWPAHRSFGQKHGPPLRGGYVTLKLY